MRDRISSLRRVKAAELTKNPGNYRKHPRAQREALRGVLSEIGYASALLAREDADGSLVLIDGHLRADLDSEQEVPVLVLDVTEAEADTLLASIDPIAAMAGSDPEALLALLGRVETDSEGLADLFEGLRRSAEDDLASLLQDPEELPKAAPSRTQPGDLFVLGDHRLVCGDATDPSIVARLMDGDKAHLFVSDPPYGVGYAGRTKKALRIANDSRVGLKRLLHASLAAADAVLRAGAPFYLFHPSNALSVVFANAVLEQGWDLRQTLIWKKDRPVVGHTDYMYEHEPIMAGYTASTKRRGRGVGGFYGGNAQSSVIEVGRPAASPDHPTSKPVELLQRLVSNSSRKGQTVLDPFAGSGSTLIACEQLGRRARVIEIDPTYCDVILARFESLTGQPAMSEEAS
jgi:site-specific DNA-methyltransferase (adenine-specific)